MHWADVFDRFDDFLAKAAPAFDAENESFITIYAPGEVSIRMIFAFLTVFSTPLSLLKSCVFPVSSSKAVAARIVIFMDQPKFDC